MKISPEKDLYSILGVTSNATVEEIREAYISRMRVIHPDRFDQHRQPQEWKKANEMLTELNEAYSILYNSSSRAQYDNLQKSVKQRTTTDQKREPDASYASSVEFAKPKVGYATFSKLPPNVQNRLLKRQRNKGEDQFQLRLSNIEYNYIFIVILLCWFVFLFINADGAKWKTSTLVYYSGITLVIGSLIGRNWASIFRWAKANLKSYFYITPIYFIKTEYDVVSFRPIWTLKDISVTHNYNKGSYNSSSVVLQFDGYNETLTLISKEQVENLIELVHTFTTRSQTAYAKRNLSYFQKNDDFYNVASSGIPTMVFLTRRMKAFIYGISVLICGIGLIGAIDRNEGLSRKRWIQHPVPETSKSYATPPYVVAPESLSQSNSSNLVIPEYPPQERPRSGAIATWTKADRIAPLKIRAADSSNCLLKLVDAYTYMSVMTVFVRSGTTVEVEVPLGTYILRFASGETWYGYKYLFGPETVYNKSDETFTFEIVGEQINGYTVTLENVAYGNLHTSEINPKDF